MASHAFPLRTLPLDSFANAKEAELTKFTNDAEFVGEVLNSSEPVIVDFTADWCPPCKVIAPFLDEIAVELKGRAKVIKIDVDENPYTTTQYGVRSMPTLMIFKAGEPISMQVGAAPKARLLEWINRAL